MPEMSVLMLAFDLLTFKSFLHGLGTGWAKSVGLIAVQLLRQSDSNGSRETPAVQLWL